MNNVVLLNFIIAILGIVIVYGGLFLKGYIDYKRDKKRKRSI